MTGRRALRIVRTWSLGAALMAASSVCFAQGASLDSATDAQKKAAQKAFIKGASAAGKGKHDEALTAFKESYDAVASPNSHLMYARELVAVGRLAEAYEEFEKIIPEAEAAAASDEKYRQAAEAARKDMTDLESKIALVTVTGAAEGDIVRIRGRELEKERIGKPIPVMPGSVKVEVVSSDGKERAKEVDAQAGGRLDVDMAPEVVAPPVAAPEEKSDTVSTDSSKWDKRTWAYVAGGVGAAGIVTFGVFGLMSNSKHSKLEDDCKNGICPKGAEDDRDTGQTYQTVANVGLVVGIVGLGAGTALYLMSEPKTEKQARRQAPKSRVDVAVGHQSVTVFGTF